VQQKIYLDYNTPLKKVKDYVFALEKTIGKDPDVDAPSARVNLVDFGEYAIVLKVFFNITDTSSYARYLDIRERILLKIKMTTEKMGVENAYPTQTLRIHEGTKLKTTRGRKTY